MKQNIKSLVVLLMLITSSVIFPKETSAQQGDVSFQVFYDQLSPYGQWVDYQNYGYVWVPDVGSDFVPYSTGGHWISTVDGWTWVSDYDWGWAPFHYGRWSFDNSYGWLWVPGNEWGPSWVNWRRADGYYGWSPMEPGISISAGFGRSYDSNNDHWMFVRNRDFDRSEISRYYVSRADHDRIVRQSTVINTTYVDNSRHTTYVTGPARADVQKFTGHKITPVAIRENSKPGQKLNNGQLQMYRPHMNSTNNVAHKPAPSKIANLKDIKRPSERSGISQPGNSSPQNNKNAQTSQPRNATPANNNAKIPNGNNKVQPSKQQHNATPGAVPGRASQTNSVKTQRTNKVQASQTKKTAPATNTPRVQQTKTAKPQNTKNAQTSQPRNVTPAPNTRHVQQPTTAKPQNANSNRTQPAQQQRSTSPATNPVRTQPQNAPRPQNVNRAQPAPQQQKAPPANNGGRVQQPAAPRPPQNNNEQQPRESNPEKR